MRGESSNNEVAFSNFDLKDFFRVEERGRKKGGCG